MECYNNVSLSPVDPYRKCERSPTLAHVTTLVPAVAAPARRAFERSETISRSALEIHLPELHRLLEVPAAAASDDAYVDESSVWAIGEEIKWHREWLDINVHFESKFPEKMAAIRKLCGE